MPKPQIQLIKDAGVVGAGGAGFPSHIKFDAKASTLIINAAECEPMIHADKQLILNYFPKIYDGIKIAAGLVEAKRVVLALKAKYSQEIKIIEDFKKGHLTDGPFELEIFKLGNFYPAGDEHVLVFEITGRIVPEGGIPLMVGSIVANVETLLNVSNAVEGKSVTRKFVTVNGEVKNPATFEVPVGTPVSVLLDYCGLSGLPGCKVIDGGPMMGKIIDEASYAVKKTTKSIIVLPGDSIAVEHKLRSIKNTVKRAQAICLSCRMCTDLCPRYLLGHGLFPDDLMKKMYRGELKDEDFEKFDFAYLCCDCGLCELYSCIVDLSARSLFNYIKENLSKKGIKNAHRRQDLSVNEFRDYRKIPIERLEKRIEVDGYFSRALLSGLNTEIKEVKLYLCQHIGAAAVPVVSAGDKVVCGQEVARAPEGKFGSDIHSSIDGTVAAINNEYITVRK